ncbi:hypothetical protein DRP05_11330 [Archaeoglobales archaeon]|nr:MAG: hypothetical protein DRP05_11330 [Archaeoglobales archaeon]
MRDVSEYLVFVERARRAEKAFKILWKNGLYEDALSRGYYAIIHLCFAILIKNDLTIPKTHAGLIAKLWQCRKDLKLDEKTIKSISRIQSLRESSDYGVVPTITEDDLKVVEEVIRNLKEVLGC